MSFPTALRRLFRSTFATLAALVFTALAVPPPLGAAEPHAIIARGFEPDQIYDFNSIDHVNLFNGNLVVTIPIGQRYPVNAGFEYGFTLVYNSHIWDYVVDCPADGIDEYGETDVPELFLTDPASAGRACSINQPPDQPLPKALRGIPNPKSNAGTGWRLTLGELYDVDSPLVPNRGWTFVGPDGAERNFAPAEGGTSGTFPQFSRDGSHLRLRTGTASDTPACSETSGGCRVVERPDGVHYAFEPVDTPAGWRLRRIEDRFGNGVSISYPGGDWQVVDSEDREHWVHFDGAGNVSSIDLAAFGGARAEYTFWTSVTDPMLPGCPHDFDLPSISELPTLTHLTAIDLPDGSRYELSYVEDDGSTGPCTAFQGRLDGLTLPTGGGIDYEYGQYLFPTKPCDRSPVKGGVPPASELVQWGIDLRTTHDIDGTQLAETHYKSGGLRAAPAKQNYIDPQSGVEICIQPRTTYTDVYEKADGGRYKLTRNFFAIAQSQGGPQSPTDPDRLPGETFRYGLPIDHLTPDPNAPSDPSAVDRFRSSMVFACPAFPAPTDDYGPVCAGSETGSCWPGDALHLQVPTSCYDVDADGDTSDRFLFPDEVRGLRDTYLQHEAGAVHYCDGSFSTNPECERANWRIKLDRTYFFDSIGDYHVQTARSGFDGYGHYRTTTSSSNRPNSPPRTTFVDFQPEVSAGTWLLDLVDERKVTEAGQTSRETYTYDPMNGFFLETRTTHRTGGNLLATFTPDAVGNVATETYSGGNPGERGYFVQNQFSNGTLSYSASMDGSRTILRTLDADVDRDTGLPSASRDASNLETVYEFDDLGRLTRLAQQGALAEAATTYTYMPAMGGSRAFVRVDRGDTRSWIEFDGLGRANETRTRLPGGVINRRFTIFTPMGQAKTVTTLHDSTAISGSKKTETDYDVFGRPTRIDNPDHDSGADSRTTFFYDGIFETVRRIHDIETPNGPLRLQTRFHHDHQGRLITVEDTELPDTGTATLKLRTRYTYDEGGRLVRVSQGGGTQLRTFRYDEAGLLTRECHPELAGGCIAYGAFDARGNPGTLRYSQAAGAPFGLDYERDAAGRLLRVTAGDDGRLLKEFFYNNLLYGSNEADDPTNGNGKLHQARRHNPFGSLDLVATTTHRYSGIGGRLSERTVATGGDGTLPRVRFTTRFGYDELGNLDAITYPTCDQADACGEQDTGRTVHRDYTRGLLTQVGTATDPDHYAALTYHPNVTLAHLLHGNGVTDAFAQDPSQMPRPGGVEVRTGASPGAGTLWQAAYTYDGSGNLVSRQTSGFNLSGVPFSGTDLFRYDHAFNRLASATIHFPTSAGGTSSQRTFSYDAFGNLFSIGGDASRSFSTDPATNRLEAPYTYDAAGNLTSQPHGSGTTSLQQWFYSYDPFMMMTRAFLSGGSVQRNYIYTADDERLAVLTPTRELWTLRGSGNEVLRDVEYLSTGWRWLEDYVHGGPGLLATEGDTGTGTETKHYHLDHLGSPRLVTSSNQAVVAQHVHAPYGEELTSPLQDGLRMKFTGHERDSMDLGDESGDLDYMHARYYSGSMGRFLSMDPGKDWDKEVSQSWNLYTYVRNNPLNLTDPTGRCSDPGGPGTRICVQTFIPSPTFGGFKGDDRGAKHDGGTYRTSQFLNVSSEEPRALLKHSFDPGESVFGPLAREAVVADQDVVPTSEGLMVSAEASDGLLFGAAPNLEYDLTIAPGEDGELSVSGSHTAFPSLEVWVYEDGKEPQLIYLHEASAEGFGEGIVDINRTVEVPE